MLKINANDNVPTPAELNPLVVLFNAGRYVELENRARLMIQQYPNSGFAWRVLGAALRAQGKDALPAMQKATELLPEDAEAHSNLGNALRDSGQLDRAVVSYRRALEIKPDYAEAYSNLGNALHDLGQLDGAIASCRQALKIKPNFAEAHSCLGNALQDLGQLDGAVASYRRALEIKPDYAEVHSNLGNALQDLGQLDGAVASYRRALEIKPDYAEAHNNLGAALQDIGQLDGALANFRRALEIKSNYAEAYSNLANVLRDIGQFDGAVANYRRALEIEPNYAEAYSNLLFCLAHSPTLDAETLFIEHCRFGKQFETHFRATCPRHVNSRNIKRSLRIGFVSADLRTHAVIDIFEPVLAHLTNYPQLSLYAYSNHAIEDVVTQRIRKYFTQWQFIVGMSDAALAERVCSDRIDILVDLSGHTGKNRLLVFARKPAPVQVSWIGYPGTTGLRSMDYYLADHFFLPHEEFGAQFIEKIVYLPALAAFMPSKEAPSFNALPALSNNYVTFGSFNRLNKLNPSVIASWSRLLRALPESKMLIGAMPQDGYDALIGWFAQEGIVQERLSFHPRSSIRAYLTLHHQVDICLDAFPYNGSTTTCHALWMGVPTLTMAGVTPPSRAGVTCLNHVGLEGFVAHDANDFVRKGLDWSNNVEALARIRTGLRARCEQSSMCQPALIADGLQRAFHIMWQRWCDGLPPVTLDMSDNQVNQANKDDK